MKIKSGYPLVGTIVSLFFIGCSLALFLSPYAGSGSEWLAVFMLSMGIFFLLLIDQSYMSIDFDGTSIHLTGFFKIKNIRLKTESILGYEIHQRVDEFNGLHNMLVLVLEKNERVVFPRIAYADYDALELFFKSTFKFLEYKPLKYAAFFKKWVPIVSLISGLLALLVGLQKLL